MYGDEVEFHIYTYVCEDALQLFGFVVELECAIFLFFCEVKGIGFKLVMIILGGVLFFDLLGLVVCGDVCVFMKIKGLG